jgi:3-dehydrosphinganine reductase
MPHAIITGGTSGIGKAIACLLAKNGYNLSLIARDQDKLDLTRTELLAMSPDVKQQIKCYSADVSQKTSIETIITTAIAAQGSSDLLITSAGDANAGYVEELPIEDFKHFMDVNYLGTVYTIRAALPSMLAHKRGQIVIISSMAGLVGSFGYASYAPTKAALKSFAEILRLELKPYAIHISICYPPDTDTPLLAKENKTRPLETKLLNKIAGCYSPETVAKDIMRGIHKKQFAIVPGWTNYLFYFLLNPVLSIWFAYADFIIKKARKIRL